MFFVCFEHAWLWQGVELKRMSACHGMIVCMCHVAWGRFPCGLGSFPSGLGSFQKQCLEWFECVFCFFEVIKI